MDQRPSRGRLVLVFLIALPRRKPQPGPRTLARSNWPSKNSKNAPSHLTRGLAAPHAHVEAWGLLQDSLVDPAVDPRRRSGTDSAKNTMVFANFVMKCESSENLANAHLSLRLMALRLLLIKHLQIMFREHPRPRQFGNVLQTKESAPSNVRKSLLARRRLKNLPTAHFNRRSRSIRQRMLLRRLLLARLAVSRRVSRSGNVSRTQRPWQKSKMP
mmetsp:Transcript_20761/g.33503  ORF Transcript_20761/g.33503 Transcript_20761/m.33503 type:complete len:215 (+) Transcript_20761:1-645(+)